MSRDIDALRAGVKGLLLESHGRLIAAIDAERARLAVEAPRLEPTAVIEMAESVITAGLQALSKRHHPDAGGTDADMALLNAAVCKLRSLLRVRDDRAKAGKAGVRTTASEAKA
jgi:hypothetical protein